MTKLLNLNSSNLIFKNLSMMAYMIVIQKWNNPANSTNLSQVAYLNPVYNFVL